MKRTYQPKKRRAPRARSPQRMRTSNGRKVLARRREGSALLHCSLAEDSFHAGFEKPALHFHRLRRGSVRNEPLML